MKPVCVKCQRFYRPKQNGTYFIEGMPNGRYESSPPGLANPDAWSPYKLWVGDIWECKGCGHELIVGVPPNPIREHYHKDFKEEVARLGAVLQVNDC